MKSTGSIDIDLQIQQYLKWDKNSKTNSEVVHLLESGNAEELINIFSSRLQFGTAGLRAAMGPGYARLNDLTIIQTTQGLYKTLQTSCTDDVLTSTGVVIGYDGRHNSRRFADLAASVFLHNNVPVYLFSKLNPTPFVPYAVVKYNCCCGVMVTASHNPKEDNGYKVYWANGAQIIAPIDRLVAESIEENLEPWPEVWDCEICVSSPLRRDPYTEVMTSYMSEVQQFCHHRDLNADSDVKFTYTAMHGVGRDAMVRVFESFDLKPFIPVLEQVDPDPEFPTVRFPNPEEGKSALDLSMQTADRNGSTVILANDPDADRLAIAEKQPGGEWRVFTGNEIGALLGWWALTCEKRSSQQHLSDCYFISSTVSSKILQTLAAEEGCGFEETLTGFKWMANKAKQLEEDGKRVLFTFEEAIGFMCGTMVLDKDGISAGAIAAEMTCYLKKNNHTLTQQLNSIFDKYGHHVCQSSYYICHNKSLIREIFHRIRTYQNDSYPTQIRGFELAGVRDLTTGYDSDQPDERAILPTSSSSQMLTLTFTNNCVLTIRTSGTEPKIKYYAEQRLSPTAGISCHAARKQLAQMMEDVITELLQPERNHLLPQQL